MEIPYVLIMIFLGAISALGILIFLVKQYKVCSPNSIMVIYGKVGGDASKVFHGGAQFVIPIFQKYKFMSLEPITIDIDLKNALSKQNIRVHVPSKFTVRIGTTEEMMANAANSLLNMNPEDIVNNAGDIIFGQLRATIAQLDIEEINSDRQAFEAKVVHNIESQLDKIGLELLNVNITDISDDSGYISALGEKAAATAVNQAKIEVARENKNGEIGRAKADEEREIEVAKAEANAYVGKNLAKAREAKSEASLKEETAKAEAEAKQNIEIAQAQALKGALQSQTEAELARAEKEEAQRQAEIIVPAEIEKQRVVLAAEAEKAKVIKAGEAEAEKVLAMLTAKANGEKLNLLGKAEGFRQIVLAAGGNPDSASQLLIIEQLPQLVEAQATAVSGLDFGKITVIDSGGGNNGGLSGFVNSFAGMLPGIHEMAKTAGLDLPNMFGKTANGKQIAPVAANVQEVNGLNAQSQDDSAAENLAVIEEEEGQE